MASIRLLSLASLLAALLLVPASPSAAFRSGGWDGQANHADDGRFSDCTMLAEYKSGITLAFIISRDFDWGLVLANDAWDLDAGSAQDVMLRINSRPPIPAIAKVVDAKGILIPLENPDPVADALREERHLTIVTDSGQVPFRLTGAREAIALLAACVGDALKAEKVASSDSNRSALRADPPATAEPSGSEPSAPTSDRPNKLFTKSEAVALASVLLRSAGIDNYEIIDPAENPMPDFDVVWTYENGIIGALAGYDDMSAVDLDEAASAVIADDAKTCEGNFASGRKQSKPGATVGVRRLFTACRTGDEVLEVHYTLFKTARGHLIQIAHIDLGDASGDIATADSPFLGGAALANFE